MNEYQEHPMNLQLQRNQVGFCVTKCWVPFAMLRLSYKRNCQARQVSIVPEVILFIVIEGGLSHTSACAI